MKSRNIALTVAGVAVVIGGLAIWQMSMTPAPQPVSVNPPVNVPPTPPVEQAPPTAPATVAASVTMVVLKEDPKLGSYLADNNGRALYIFAKDYNGQSSCAGDCATVWPSFYLANVTIGPGLDMGDFRTITRPDGSTQTTYYNWPLYYYSGDAATGDVKGDAFNKLWSVAKPDYTVLVANKNNLNYLIDADTGLTLYQYSKDSASNSNCNGACAKTWPPFYVTKIVGPSYLDKTAFGTFVRQDQTNQTSFTKIPLYHDVEDKVPGDMKGQGFDGFWTTVDPSGKLVTP